MPAPLRHLALAVIALIFLIALLPSTPAAARSPAAPAVSGSSQSPPPDEKKKVEKPETRRRRSDGDQDKKSDDDDDEEEETSCFGSCLGDVVSSMFMSLFSSDDKDETSEEAPPDTLLTGHFLGAQDTSGQAYEPLPPGAPAWPLFRLGILLHGGASALVGPHDVRKEFDQGLFRYGLQVLWRPSSLLLDLTAGYGQRSGEPQYNFVTSSVLDSPQETKIRLFDLALRIGQAYPLGDQATMLHWGVGPRLCWVRQTARIDSYALPDRAFLGERRESLERWRLGGDVVLGVAHQERRWLFDLQTTLSIVPWRSHEERSLMLDFIGRHSLVIWGASAAIGYDVF